MTRSAASSLPESDGVERPADAAKRPYVRPELIAYGTLREITLNAGGVVGKNDGGAGKDKTG